MDLRKIKNNLLSDFRLVFLGKTEDEIKIENSVKQLGDMIVVNISLSKTKEDAKDSLKSIESLHEKYSYDDTVEKQYKECKKIFKERWE